MATALQARDAYLAELRRFDGELPGDDRPWLAAIRRQARERFAEIGFPAPKSEDWKYTRVSPLLKTIFRPLAAADKALDEAGLSKIVEALPGVGMADSVLVFVDGYLAEPLSRVVAASGVEVSGLRESLAAGGDGLEDHFGRYLDVGVHGFAALNTALAGDGAVVRLARGAAAEHPVHLLFYATARKQPTLAQPRNLIVAEDGSSGTVVEHYAGEPGATYLRNAATEIALGRDAALVHVKVQAESESGYHVHRIQAYQNAGSSFTSHAIALGAALSRTEIATTLDGEGAGCAMLGLYVVQGSQHVDHHTTIDHAKPRTTSRELYKGILDESSRGVFTGKVLVRKDAQQISAEQTNRNLLLAAGAQVEMRPQLEIYADDVKCTHGAAVGKLDEDALFYMRQRGIDPAQARSLLTYGFASEVLSELGIDELREALEQTVLARVRRGGEGRNA